MAILTLNIDRSDTEVTSVTCKVDSIDIADSYAFAPAMSDAVIEQYIRNDLTDKGYSLT